MKILRENKIRQKVCEYAEINGCKIITPSSLDDVGVVDREFLTPNGITFYAEFKTEIGRLRPAQRYWISELLSRHAYCFVIRSIEHGKNIVNEMLAINNTLPPLSALFVDDKKELNS